jgi:hypothetical protein
MPAALAAAKELRRLAESIQHNDGSPNEDRIVATLL